MYFYPILLLGVAVSVSAWFPHEKNMTSIHGNNLFEAPSNISGASNTTVPQGGKWLPGKTPIRGVNLGSQFVLEPWMAQNEWPNVLNCDANGQPSEFDCVLHLGQSTANTNFANHWKSWITQNDILTMSEYGLNTIRIGVGYWMDESLKYPRQVYHYSYQDIVSRLTQPSEYFPEGGIQYLSQICGWASDEGFYIIIDLHGAPFGQVGQNADTGQMAQAPTDQNQDFYQDSQYDRALSFLQYMTNYIHNNGGSGPMRNVGMIEILNEPIGVENDLTDSMREKYYPQAFSTIRAAENTLGVADNNKLHIQMMNNRWGSGEPDQYLTDNYFAAYDYHRYLTFDPTISDQSQQGYIDASCNSDVTGDYPLIVGEWSIAINQDHENEGQFFPATGGNLDFYKRYFAAQAGVYESQSLGWIFWSWKTELENDPRWNYQAAVQAGIIPKNLNDVSSNNPC